MPSDRDAQLEQAARQHAKHAIRARMRSLRRVLPAEARAARSDALCARLLELPELASARTVVGYCSVHGEIDPARALHELAARGVALGLPRVGSDMRLELRCWIPDAELQSSALGIAEPRADASELDLEAIDVILVPALALDLNGHRLGYGQGYYDRLLPRLPRALSIGVGYDFQLLGELPSTKDDVALSMIVTDARSLRAAS